MTLPERASAPQRILLTGGTGFVGSAIRKQLGHHDLTLLVRHHDDSLKTHAQVVGDVSQPTSIEGICDGIDTVVHLVGIIEEHGDTTFDSIIRQGTRNIIDEARRAGVERFVHMSALGAQDNPAFPYHEAKWQAEQYMLASGIPSTIFRPSVIFGPGDGFLSTLSNVVRKFPLTPVIGSGNPEFQPVYIDDVAACFRAAVERPADMSNSPMQLGGPEVFSFEGLLDMLRELHGIRRPKVHIPKPLMQLVVGASAPLPDALRPPVTKEQLAMLRLDNTTPDSWTARILGHTPTPLRGSLGYLR